MGADDSKPITAQPNIVDYSANVTYPEETQQIQQKVGPNASSFPEEGENLVLSDFNACLTHNPGIVRRYHLYRISFFVCCFVFTIGGILVTYYGIEANETANEMHDLAQDTHNSANDGLYGDVRTRHGRDIFYEEIFGAIALIALVLLGVVWWKKNQAARDWRDNVADQLRLKLGVWKSTYPHLEFTVLFPVNAWKDGGLCRCRSKRMDGKIIGSVWCYVRVTQGPSPAGVDERIYATTSDGNGIQNQQGVQMITMQNPQQYGQQVGGAQPMRP
eukprot:189725_1